MSRSLSRRERERVDGFIADICRELSVRDPGGDLHQCAWAAFLSVYRMDPLGFCSGLGSWKRAYLAIWDALEQARRESMAAAFRQTSLDQPVDGQDRSSRLELLPLAHGDFQNGVCLRDYLQRMDRDVCRMAYGLMNGESLDEMRVYYHWSRDYSEDTYNSLRAEMEDYLRI